MSLNLKEEKLNSANIDFFLEDEVRNGFYVPAVMKQCWAAEIKVMQELKEVCDRHDIKFYADWGSLLGAVRHGGFIPWDDDLDVLMVREDYMKLISLYESNPEEFPDGFEVRSFRNREDYTEFHGVVVGCGHISFEPAHLEKYYGFPYITGVDIFVLDHKAEDIEDQSKMAKEALFTIALADEIGDGKLKDKASIEANLKKIRGFKYAKNVPANINLSPVQLRIALYEVAENMFSSFREENSGKLIQNVPWGLLKPENEIPGEYYAERAFLPFEYSELPVPIAYDTMLSKKYGDYLRIVKNVGAHEYPCFAEQERQFKESLDFEVPEFKYDENHTDELKKLRDEARENSWKETVRACLSEMERIGEFIKSEEPEDVLQALADLQQLAIDLGTFIESVTGTDGDSNDTLLSLSGKETVKSLEAFCEAIFNLYNAVSSDDNRHDFLMDCFEAALRNIFLTSEKLISVKEVVVLTFKPEGWKYVDSKYRLLLNEGADVKVIPIPYFHKSYDGRIKDEVYITEGYPEDVELFSYKDYDFSIHHPDEIITQFPYDSWNPVMTVSPEYYVDSLFVNTEKLTYIPWFKTSDFTEEDYCDYVNTKYYVSTPGVCYSDETVVSSEAIKGVYLKRLEEFAGASNLRYLDGKIVVGLESNKESEQLPTNNTVSPKNLFYYLGLCSFLQSPEQIMEKIKSNFTLFKETDSNVIPYVFLDPAIGLTLPKLRPNLWSELQDALANRDDKIHIIDNYITPEEAADNFTAYYGDRGRYVIAFTARHKPVMIQNPEII